MSLARAAGPYQAEPGNLPVEMPVVPVVPVTRRSHTPVEMPSSA